MKIVCDSCGTKYSIADEKVKGKVFKIRCKKCSHVIVVRSAETPAGEVRERPEGFGGAEDPPTTVSKNAMASVQVSEALRPGTWHAVIGGQQTGPLAAQQIRTKFSARELDIETFVWKDGMADWVRLGSVEEFRDLVAENPFLDEGKTRQSDRNVFANDGTAAEAAADDRFGRGSTSGSRSTVGDSSLFSAPIDAPTTVSAPVYRTAGASPSSSAMGGSEAKPLTGQRNESSVLFSLNNLSALGGGAKAGPAQPSGFANSQTEGSGLIDIRAMAAATLAKSPALSPRSDSQPAIPSAPVFSTMSAPILLPAAPAGPPKWLWGVVAMGILAFLGFIGVGVLFFLHRAPPPAVVTVPGPALGTLSTGVPPVTAAPVPALGATPPAQAAGPMPGAPALAPAAPVPAPGTAPIDDKGAKRVPSLAKITGKSDKGAKLAKVANTALPPPPVSDAKKVAVAKRNTSDAIDDLLNKASPDSAPRRVVKEDSAEKDDGVPEQLDKAAIIAGMGKIKSKVLGCYDQYKSPGQANVSVSISHSGKVSSATVTGVFDGTPTGSCIERAVKSASFSSFKGATQTITYPFVLR